MVLESYRGRESKYLAGLAKRFTSTRPNTLTWTAFGSAVGGALLISLVRTPDLWYILFFASVCIFLNGLFDLLDGEVARLTNRTSRRGDLLDHVLDRYSDILLVTAMVSTPFASIYLGYAGVLGVILASYMGTQAQAVGAGRIYAGMLSRSDRIAILTFAPLFQMVFLLFGWDIAFSLSGYDVHLSVFDLVLIWFAVVGNATAIQRAYITWRRVGE